jgi:hypothetical protein
MSAKKSLDEENNLIAQSVKEAWNVSLSVVKILKILKTHKQLASRLSAL